MKIFLKNFKCWKSKIVDIDDGGIQLLSGESGRGKSSILDSIYFCLYGGGQKIITHGQKSCQVDIEWGGSPPQFKITRSRRPNRLVVVRKEPEWVLEDDIAQEFINKTFGYHFSQTSYIRQNIFENFIFMSPTEKLEFLEDSVLKKFDVDSIKSRVQNHIKKLEQEINIKSGQYSTYKEIFENTAEPELVEFPIQTNTKNRETVIKNEYTKVHNFGVMIKKYSRKLATTRQLIDTTKNLRDSIAALDIRVAEVETRKQELTGKAELLKSDGETLEGLTDTLKRIDLHNTYLTISKNLEIEKGVYDNLLKQEIDGATTAIKKIDKTIFRDLESTIETLKTKIKYLPRITQIQEQLRNIPENMEGGGQEQIDTLVQNTALLQNRLDLYNKTLICPCCHTRVLYRDSKLEKYRGEEIGGGLPTQLSAEIENNTAEILRLKEASKHKEKRDRLEQELGGLPCLTALESKSFLLRELENSKKLYDNMVATLNENKRLKKLLETLDFPSLARSRQLIDSFQRKLKHIPRPEGGASLENLDREDIRVQIEKIQSDNRLKREYLTQIQDIDIRLEVLRGDRLESQLQLSAIKIPSIEGLEGSLESARSQLEISVKNVEKIEKWKVYNKDIDSYRQLQTNLERLNLESTQHRHELALCQKFKNTILKSETLSIQQFISTINTHVQIYLDHFFKNDQLLVKIETQRQLKGGAGKITKSQITLNMEYGGWPIELSNLSGGELSRLNLAFVLALSEIFQSPILMLDESMSTLDPDNCCNVLETVRENYKGKLVIMVHHQITEGLFNRVIPL